MQFDLPKPVAEVFDLKPKAVRLFEHPILGRVDLTRVSVESAKILASEGNYLVAKSEPIKSTKKPPTTASPESVS
jgi:hypothetical protein